MIIRGVIFFLRVFDFVCDVYDGIKELGVKINKPTVASKDVLSETDPSFSL